MKFNVLLAILVTVMAWVTCKNLQKTQDNEQSAPETATDEKGPSGWNASRVFNEYQPDSAGTYQSTAPPRLVDVPIDALPPATASHKAYLSDGYWHMNMAYQPSDTTVHQNYQQKWLKFRQDQTFDILINGKPVDTGRWNFDEDKYEIYLSCKDPYINNTWKVIEKGFVMIWKGNTKLNVTGIQVRVVGSGTLPFGQ